MSGERGAEMPQETDDKGLKKVALIIVSIIMFVSAIMMSSVNVAVPPIAREFGMEAALAGWLTTAMTLPQVALMLPMGRLADIRGRKKTFLYGTLLFTAATGLCAAAPSSAMLLAGRVLQGIGGSMMFGVSMALLASVYPKNEIGRAFGVTISAMFVGMSIGPYLGGVITDNLGWRAIFGITAFLCLVCVGLIVWRLKGEWAEAAGEKFDTVGSVVLGVSLVLLLYGFTRLTDGYIGIVLFAVGVIGVFVYAVIAPRLNTPILNIDLFRRNAVFVFSNITNMFHFLGATAAVFLMNYFLQSNQGYTTQQAGSILVATPAAMAIFSWFTGRLSDKLRPQLLAALGMLLMTLSMAVFIFLQDTTPLWLIISSLALLGIGMAFFASPNGNAVMASVKPRFFGIASAMLNVTRACGQMLGMGIVMILFVVYIGNAQITPENYGAFLVSARTGFLIFAIISFAGVFTQLVGMKSGGAPGE